MKWDVIQVDPKASNSAPSQLETIVRPDAFTALVLMTHNLGLDTAYLAEGLQQSYPYIGVVGSRRRSTELVKAIEGLVKPELLERIDALRCPAGLDIGGDSAEVIALSIIAEIQSFWSGRTADQLRERIAPIHCDYAG